MRIQIETSPRSFWEAELNHVADGVPFPDGALLEWMKRDRPEAYRHWVGLQKALEKDRRVGT